MIIPEDLLQEADDHTKAQQKVVDDEVPDNQASSSSQPNAGLPAALTKAQQKVVDDITVDLMNAKETKATDDAGEKKRKLAHNIHQGRKRKSFTLAQEIELNELRKNSVHPRDRVLSAKLLEEAQEPANPMEGCAGDSENRLGQDLLLLANGYRTRDLLRRLQKYQHFIADPDTSNTDFAQRYKERIVNAAAAPQGPSTYVPGTDIRGSQCSGSVPALAPIDYESEP